MSRYAVVFVALLLSHCVHAKRQVLPASGDGLTLDARTVCGDEIIDPGEESDDGNTDGGDGCSSGCCVEASHACTGQPSACGLSEDCNSDRFDKCGWKVPSALL
ncbi:MAG: hypothetical protein JSU63_18425 [Phycisphaerales bacterium]|nr:MAG: hypothetical protein JSU63_18425 [Phycisphaerales bacterium]